MYSTVVTGYQLFEHLFYYTARYFTLMKHQVPWTARQTGSFNSQAAVANPYKEDCTVIGCAMIFFKIIIIVCFLQIKNITPSQP